MNVITIRPKLFAVNSHHDENGDWQDLDSYCGMSVEPNSEGVCLVLGSRFEACDIVLAPDEARMLAGWLLEVLDARS